MTATILHQSVLLKEAIKGLNIKPKLPYLDCTLGSAGHAEEIIKKGGKLFGIDQDPKAVQRSRIRLEKSCPQAELHLEVSNFNHLNDTAKHFKVKSFAGILFDLGLSSEQLADPDKGLSFQTNEPLDMRTDPNLQITAADLVNGLHKGELSKLLSAYGQEQYHLAIANSIVKARKQRPIKTTQELADLVSRAKKNRGKTHPATQTFQALRIAVNDELNNLEAALPQAVSLLKSQGRLVIISFHSLEDKIVKNFFKGEKSITIITQKPITPTREEIISNPRSRSAKLRIAKKI